MDLKTFRSTLAAIALLGTGAVQAALPTYSASTVTFPSQTTDTSFFVFWSLNFDYDNHMLMRRNDGTAAGAQFELYDLANLATPVLTMVNPADHTHPLAGEGNIIGEYVYLERFRYIDTIYTKLGIFRCHYTAVDCSNIDDSAIWSLLPGTVTGLGTQYTKLTSNARMSGAIVYSWHGASTYHHNILRPDGSSFEFAVHPQIYAMFSSSRVAGYVDGKFTVLVWDGSGSTAYVFDSLDPSAAHAFPIGAIGGGVTEPLSMNASGRAAFLTRASLSDATGTLWMCDLSITTDPVTGDATGISCPQTTLGTTEQTLGQTFATMKDDNELVIFDYKGGVGGDTFVWDTSNVGAAPITLASLTMGAVTGPLAALTLTDGRILAIPFDDALNMLMYTYTLLTPSGGSGGGNSVVVNPQPSVINPGDSRSVLIRLDITAENLYGLQYSCHADPSILEFVSGEYPALPDSLAIPLAYDPQTAVVDGALSLRAPALPFTGTGTFSVLNYLATAPYGTTDVTCDVLGSDIDGNAIVFTVQNGTVTINDGVHVSGGATISGVASLPYGTDWSGIQVTLTIGGTSVTTTTDATGYYSFSDILDGTISITFDTPRLVAQCLATTVTGGASATMPTSSLVTGDINDDNVIDIADFTLMAGHFGSHTGQSRYLAIADLNADGKVNIQDLSILGSHFHMPDPNCTNV